MWFDRTWMRARCNVAWLVIACGLLSACGSKKEEGINPDQRLRVARAAETAGNMVMARSMYAEAAAETEGNRSIQLPAAEGLARTGALSDAMDVLNGILRRSPGDQDARRTLGSIQITNGQPGEAVQTLSTVLAAHPDDDIARFNKAVALDMLNRHAEAQPLYRAALLKNPSDVDAANDLALSLLLSGQPAAAKAVLAPFRGRVDMPDRLRATIQQVDQTPDSPADQNPANVPGPTLLKQTTRAGTSGS